MDAVLASFPPFNFSELLKMPSWATSEPIAFPQLDDARDRTAETQAAVEQVKARIDELQKQLPERNADLDGLKADLSKVQDDLAKQREAVSAARQEIMQLMPDPVQFAYLKIAKAEVSDLRDLVEHHIDTDHKRKQLLNSRRALWLSGIAIAVSFIGMVVSIFSLAKP
jgi:septal ring factor EnvC (AmiA/AmiB activator)